MLRSKEPSAHGHSKTYLRFPVPSPWPAMAATFSRSNIAAGTRIRCIGVIECYQDRWKLRLDKTERNGIWRDNESS